MEHDSTSWRSLVSGMTKLPPSTRMHWSNGEGGWVKPCSTLCGVEEGGVQQMLGDHTSFTEASGCGPGTDAVTCQSNSTLVLSYFPVNLKRTATTQRNTFSQRWKDVGRKHFLIKKDAVNTWTFGWWQCRTHIQAKLENVFLDVTVWEFCPTTRIFRQTF